MAAMPSILDVVDNPRLFGRFFDGPSWTAWKAYLAALFALPMNDAALALFQTHTGRKEPPSVPFTETALIVGRRGGKSRVLATIALYLAIYRNYRPHLAPGELATIMVIAADRKQARTIFRYILGLLKLFNTQDVIEDETNETLTLKNRVQIEIGTASFRATRGYSFAAVLCDEVAFWRSDDSSANPDREILRALRPGMASIPGSVLMIASSPYAKKGSLYDAYRRHHGKDDARVLVWKADTAAMNPKIDPAIIAEAYADDPEAARAEYGAEFRDDLADFVTREIVDAVTIAGRDSLPPVDGIVYSAFCDPSGGSADSMTLAVAHLRDGDICVLDHVLEVRAPFDPGDAIAQCVTVLRRYGITRVMGDRYAGEWPPARFREYGVEFEQSAKPKSDIYHDLLPLLNARRVELLDHQRLGSQLVGLERRTARSGRDSIDHQPGGHDDLINAAAGVLVGLDLDRRPPLVRPSDVLSDGGPAPLPAIIDAIFATLAVDPTGQAAVLYVAMAAPGKGDVKLLFVDFELGPLRANLFSSIAQRLADLTIGTRVRAAGQFVLTTETIAHQAALAGYRFQALPPSLTDADPDLVTAGTHLSAGRVKLTPVAYEKSRSSPLGAALTFRGGEQPGDPLRTAACWAIAAALDTRR